MVQPEGPPLVQCRRWGLNSTAGEREWSVPSTPAGQNPLGGHSGIASASPASGLVGSPASLAASSAGPAAQPVSMPGAPSELVGTEVQPGISVPTMVPLPSMPGGAPQISWPFPGQPIGPLPATQPPASLLQPPMSASQAPLDMVLAAGPQLPAMGMVSGQSPVSGPE